METREFDLLSQECLRAIEARIENSLEDVELDWQGEGILNITLGNGHILVVNRHAILQEVWLAAPSGGFHFRWNGQQWIDTRDGVEFSRRVELALSSALGQTIAL